MSNKFSRRRTRVQHKPKVCISSHKPPSRAPLKTCCGGSVADGGPIPNQLIATVRGEWNVNLVINREFQNQWRGDTTLPNGDVAHIDLACPGGGNYWGCEFRVLHNGNIIFQTGLTDPYGACKPFHLIYANAPNLLVDIFEP